MPARVVPLSQVGSSPSQIQAYIRNAHTTWPVKPEFILLVGSPNYLPPYTYSTDCNYGDMSGDYKMEISVGRFPCEDARECSTMVNKTLAYERPPEGSDSAWFGKGTTVVNEDNPYDQYYQPDSRLARGYWQSSGYTLCESLSDFAGHSSPDVNAAAADGRAFITHRGQCVGTWWPPFNYVTPNSWNNGAKLPIAVSGSCETMTLQAGATMYGDQFVRAGTPGGLGGAVAYFGTTTAGSHISDRRSAVFRGFFNSLYPEKELRLGPATIRGRFRVDSLFPGQSQWYLEWTLFGDPELNVWTASPRRIAAAYDSVIPMAPQTFSLTVTSSGSPVEGALVCVAMDTAVHATGLTGPDGNVQLDVDPTHIGVMTVTVTGRNLRPFEGFCRVIINDAPYLVESGTVFDDFVGNHDGIPNPGEQARYTVLLRNVGAYTANNVAAVLRTSDPAAILLDSTSSYGSVMPESTAAGDPYEFRLDSALADNHAIQMSVVASDDTGASWTCPVTVRVRAGRVVPAGVVLLDDAPGGNGNGRLGRGETGRVLLGVTNAGGASLSSVEATLSTTDTDVVVTDSVAWYGVCAPGDTCSGARDWFGVSAGPDLPKNRAVTFLARFRASGTSYTYSDTFSIQVRAEQGSTNEPTGPDAYGYWAYDDTDTASGRAPMYEWADLAPPGPGIVIPVVSDSDAATRTMVLPFAFKHYGTTDTVISICSNGFLALGATTYKSGNNRPIPDTAGPPNLIAPFWDDLNPEENRNGYGTAYSYYDEANNRFQIEFKDFAHYNQPTIRERFMVSFCDPAYYPTPTGDGEIVFYYNRVSLGSGCTVGVEDATETRGIQYLYNNSYAPGAATLVPGRAVKFTTNPPRGLLAPWLVLNRLRVSDTLYGNGNGRLEPGEIVEVVAFVRNDGSADAAGTACVLRALDTEGNAVDSTASFGDIAVGAQANNSAHPFLLQIASEPHDSTADIGLVMTATDYTTLIYSNVQLYLQSGIESGREQLPRHTMLDMVRPNPLGRDGRVSFALARTGQVDLCLFDAVGRRIATLASGRKDAGWYSAKVPAAQLSQGIYFCRLEADSQRFTRKLVVQR
jgi:hypothetical protein